jgi:outer membrane protein assembly factor BamB
MAHTAQALARAKTWVPPVLILTGGWAAWSLLGWADVCLFGKPTTELNVVLFATVLSLYLWVRLGSGFSLRGQCQTIVGFLLAFGLLRAAARVDGFTGDGRPIWGLRWMPSAEDRWKRASDVPPRPAPESASAAPLEPSWRDYPAFRGRDRSGVRGDVRWSNEALWPPALVWRRPVGPAWSSFAVTGGVAVTQEQRAELECVVGYDLESGAELWRHAARGRFEEVTSGPGPRATPAIDAEGRVYALGATGRLNCLDARTGHVLWTVDVLADAGRENRLFGMCGSPLVEGDLVIVAPGGPGTSLVAYDRHSGRRTWAGGDAEASYSSPHLARFSTGPQVLLFHGEGLSGHDLATGRALWSFAWVSNPAERNNVCQPVPLPAEPGRPDRVFLASGYGRGSALLEIAPRGDRYDVRPLWEARWPQAKFASVVLHGDCIYGLDDKILTCIELATGRRCWKQGRYGYGQLLLADGRLIVQAESGEIAIVAADPEGFRELHRFPALDDRTWNHPALAGDYLLVRNDREAACYRLPLVAAGADGR